MNDKPDILSLNELRIHLPQDVHNQLETQYAILNDTTTSKHIDKILKSMKTSPADTCCRVNLLKSSVDEVIEELKVHLSTIDGDFNVYRHETISDLVIIRAINKSKTDTDDSDIISLYNCSIPPNKECTNLFLNWSKRSELGWPMSHRSIVVDRYCGEAVLRGSNIFVKGILAADSGIAEQEEVAIFMLI